MSARCLLDRVNGVLVFDELTNGQAVTHYSRHCLTTSATYVTTLTYASTNDQWARPACPLVSSLGLRHSVRVFTVNYYRVEHKKVEYTMLYTTDIKKHFLNKSLKNVLFMFFKIF